HPLVIHFPIALIVTAFVCDLAAVGISRPVWLGDAVPGLYGAGAVAAGAAYWSGLDAGSDVLLRGAAYITVQEHQRWALSTTAYFGLFTAARIGARRRARRAGRAGALLCLAGGAFGVFLLQQTAERGARLVYEHGVGVIAAPWSR
ncbi:MAG: hypothetical protein HW394_174, partial [Acidobacteria bacterium]|nr:hypothetical protein [Acidobacteriota bacterium]